MRTALGALLLWAAACSHTPPRETAAVTEGTCVATIVLRDENGEPIDREVEIRHPSRPALHGQTSRGQRDFEVPCGQWHDVRTGTRASLVRAPFVAVEPRIEITLRILERGPLLAAKRVSYGPPDGRSAMLSQLAWSGMRAWGGNCARARPLMSDAGRSHSSDPIVAHAAALSAFGLCRDAVTAAQADLLLTELDPTAPWLTQWLPGLYVALGRASDERLRDRVRDELTENGDREVASLLLLHDMLRAYKDNDQATLEARWLMLMRPRFRGTYARDFTDLLRPASMRLVTGEPLPALAATTIDGRPFALERTGARTIVYAWGTFCKPCMPGLRKLVELHEREAEHAQRIVTVAIDEDHERVREFVADNGPFPFPIVTLDEHQRTSFEREYGTATVPACVLADDAGRVVATGPDCLALLDQTAASAPQGQPRP